MHVKLLVVIRPREEVNALRTEIEQFIQQHASHFLRGKLEQSIFTLLTNAEDTRNSRQTHTK